MQWRIRKWNVIENLDVFIGVTSTSEKKAALKGQAILLYFGGSAERPVLNRAPKNQWINLTTSERQKESYDNLFTELEIDESLSVGMAEGMYDE